MKCVELLLLLLLSRGVEPRGFVYVDESWLEKPIYVCRSFFTRKNLPFCRVAMVSGGEGEEGFGWL